MHPKREKERERERESYQCVDHSQHFLAQDSYLVVALLSYVLKDQNLHLYFIYTFLLCLFLYCLHLFASESSFSVTSNCGLLKILGTAPGFSL